MKIISILLTSLAVFILIWSFSEINENHRDSQQLNNEYKKLVNLYEKNYVASDEDEKIMEIKKSIKRKENPNNYSGVEPSINKYIWLVMLGLLIMVINEGLNKYMLKKQSNKSSKSTPKDGAI